MNKKQLIISLILIVALGSIFEAIKRAEIDSSKNDGMNQVLSTMDVQPFVQRSKGRSAIESERARARYLKPKVNPLTELEKLAENRKGQLALGDSPKSKTKKDGKKKKKDKKDKDDKEKTEDESDVAKDGSDKKDSPEKGEEKTDKSNEDTSTEYAGGAMPTLDETKEDTPPLDEIIADWANELLKTPNYKLLNEFISLKQTGRIPDEAFYLVVEMLLDDSRESMKLMGAFALGTTPSLRSFDLLIVTGQNAPFGSKLSEAVTRHKKAYLSLNQIKVLESVLYSSENLESIKSAADLINQAASRYLTTDVVSSSVTAQREGSTLASKSFSIFAGLKKILKSLADSSTDSGIVSSTSQALSTIIKYIPDEHNESSESEFASTEI